VVLVVWDLIVVSISLIFMLDSARTLNDQHVEHRRLLLRKLHTLQRAISGAITVDRASGEEVSLLPKTVKQYKNSLDMMAIVVQVMEAEDELAPVKILGMRANSNMLRAAVGVAGSAFVAGAKLLIG
jgi:hypothetical protein